MKDSELLTVK